MTEINYWLMKSEPETYGISDLKKESTTIWDGIRNYQARNFMRKMEKGDQVFFYHSNCKPPGIVGLMEVIEVGITDPTQFDPHSRYFDQKSTRNKPRWDCTRMRFLQEFTRKISLEELRGSYSEEELLVVKRGNRLSITPVKKETALSLIDKSKQP